MRVRIPPAAPLSSDVLKNPIDSLEMGRLFQLAPGYAKNEPAGAKHAHGESFSRAFFSSKPLYLRGRYPEPW